jgi:hypothetical protein
VSKKQLTKKDGESLKNCTEEDPCKTDEILNKSITPLLQHSPRNAQGAPFLVDWIGE